MLVHILCEYVATVFQKQKKNKKSSKVKKKKSKEIKTNRENTII